MLVGKPEVPIIALYLHGGSRYPLPKPQIILAVWGDGEAVWSKTREEGGHPYLSGKIPPEKIEVFFEKLSNNGVFKDRTRNYSVCGPDAAYTTIWISRGEEQVNMRSWHELAEKMPGAVVTADSIVLEGASPKDSLAEQPTWYRRFRENWAVIREAADELTPVEGEAATDFHFEIRLLPEKAK